MPAPQERFPLDLVPIVTEQLDELTGGVRELDTKRAEMGQKLAEHLQNIRGWVLPIKATAVEKFVGDVGFTQLSDSPADEGTPLSGKLGPGRYEIGTVGYDLFGNQVVMLHQGGTRWAVKPETIEKVSDEDIISHLQNLDEIPEQKDNY